MTGVSPRLDPDRRQRFQLAVQRNRVSTYLLAGLSAGIFVSAGLFEATYLAVLLVTGAACLSAAIFYLLIKSGLPERLGISLDPLCLVLDAFLITWGVQCTGGASSPFFIWYLANIAAASFGAGQRAAFATAVLDTVAYLALLFATGEIRGFDSTLSEPLARMVFLYAASFFFLRGVAVLQEKRHLVKKLKEAETRRVEELTRLTRALDVRTRELEAANLTMRQTDRLKSQFLANMSHELRTPLNSIIGFSDVLLTRLSEELEPKYRKFLSNINSSGQHLLHIIDDLLDLSKIEAGRMHLHPEHLLVQPVVEGVCTVMTGAARERDISLELRFGEQLQPLEADPVRFKQILYNLIANALKFSHQGSTITIEARHVPADVSPLGHEAVQVAVVDQGVGIDPRDHRLIFEEFRQADGTTTRRFGGSGLGLALVKRFVELHAGTIAVDSSLGNGATFTVTLPYRFQGEEHADSAGAPEALDLPDELGTRVLVVEDDPTAYETIAEHLGRGAFVPVRARNHEEAVRLARTVRPSAITLDIILPGLDGWEILRQLKADPVTRDIPVVIVSVLDNRELALTLGAADYLVKPVTAEDILTCLERVLPQADRGELRLLLVDDDPQLHELVEASLSSRGYRLEHANSGREGLELALRAPPDLVLLDLMMDGMDGFEVATRLRADARSAHVPVVVLTAKEMSPQDRQRLRGKIEALVMKGDTAPSGLATVIDDVMRRHRGGEGS
jgi:signal transduction histidine kinase/DNA-binding response OmpR family regulator